MVGEQGCGYDEGCDRRVEGYVESNVNTNPHCKSGHSSECKMILDQNAFI